MLKIDPASGLLKFHTGGPPAYARRKLLLPGGYIGDSPEMNVPLLPGGGFKADPLLPYLAPAPPSDPSGGGGGNGNGGGGGKGPGLGPVVPVDPGLSSGLVDAIENDPLYKQTKADLLAQHISDLGRLAAARQRAVVGWGAVPDNLSQFAGVVGSDIGNDLGDTIRQLAAQNTAAGLSTSARLQRAFGDAVDQTKNDLTARGLLSSGETGFQLGRRNDEFLQARSDQLQKLVDTLSEFEDTYVGGERGRQATLAAAAREAAGRIGTPGPHNYETNPLPGTTQTIKLGGSLIQKDEKGWYLVSNTGPHTTVKQYFNPGQTVNFGGKPYKLRADGSGWDEVQAADDTTPPPPPAADPLAELNAAWAVAHGGNAAPIVGGGTITDTSGWTQEQLQHWLLTGEPPTKPTTPPAAKPPLQP